MDIFDDRCSPHRFPSPKLDPWMFYSHGEPNCDHTFYSLSERIVHNKCIKEMLDNDIVCSMHGWLVLSNQTDRRKCQLFNPDSMAAIQLPLLSRPSYDLCALSCDPNNPNCIVMLVKHKQPMTTCYFCRPGDVVWIEKDLELDKRELYSNYCYYDRIDAIGCYKDQICIYTCFNKIFLLAAKPPCLTLVNLGVEQEPCDIYHYGKVHKYLVESDGELFLIRRFDLLIGVYDFVVYKLDISEKKKTLVVVENLGGRSFFLSSFTSGITCSAENYGIKANTIYFTQPFDACIYSFDLQTKVLTFSLPCPIVTIDLVQAEWILLRSPNPLHKLGCRVEIVSSFQIKKSTVLQPSISRSIGKDWSELVNDIINFVVEKLSRGSVDSGWSELPHDVLISIAEKLSCVTCARMSMVCKSWGSAITWAPKKLLDCPTFLHMPSSSIEISQFMNKSRYNVPVPENPNILSIQYAKDGWLLMTRDGGMGIFFLNPLTTEIIEIPNLQVQVRCFSFTSSPTSSSCSIFAIFYQKCTSRYFIYHICRGEMKWTCVAIPEFEATVELIPYSNPIFHRGLFYWIWGCGNLCTYDPTKKKVEFLRKPRSALKSMWISYLFESGKELMSLWVGRHGIWVKVYRLDRASMTWKEISTLGKKMILLSRNSNLVTKTQDLEDIICFNRFAGDNQPLMYSLRTHKLRVYGGGLHNIRNFCDIPEYQIKSAWIQPNIKRHTVRELSWDDSDQLFVTD